MNKGLQTSKMASLGCLSVKETPAGQASANDFMNAPTKERFDYGTQFIESQE